MRSITELQTGATAEIWQDIATEVRASRSLQHALQAVVDAVYDEFRGTLALARAFVTLPYAKLPKAHARIVDRFAIEHGMTEFVSGRTPILTLVASRGLEVAWNDIAQSKRHAAIPIVPGRFLERIPMVARVLADLEVTEDLGIEKGGTWSDDPGSHVRTFYVADAGADLDAKGRHVISDQDFVGKYGVKTVFGGGGPFTHVERRILVLIFFAREPVSRDIATVFDPFIETVQAETAHLMAENKLFD